MSAVASGLPPSDAILNALTKRDEHIKFPYVWVIQDTERVFTFDKEIRSPKFTIPGIRVTDFELVCKEAAGKFLNYTRRLKIELQPVNSMAKYKVTADLKLTSGEHRQEGKLEIEVGSNFTRKWFRSIGSCFGRLDQFGQQTGSNSINLGFTFFLPSKLQTMTMKTTPKMESKNLNKNLKTLLESKALSDFTIRCKKTELKCHSNILYARSAYFACLFSSDMVERKKKTMEIVDFEPESVAMMLEYLYTGDVDTTDKDLGELLALANKYLLTELSMLASERLSEQVSVDNALDVFILAENHGAEELKQVAINKVIENKATLMKNEEFRKKLLERPTLVVALLSI